MKPSFFHDYCPSIAVYDYQYEDEQSRVRIEHRVEARDENGETLIGAKSTICHDIAFWRLADFIDEELERRKHLMTP